MRRIIIVLVAIFQLCLFANPQQIFAAITCNLGGQGFNSDTGSLQYCVGGFASKAALKGSSVVVSCAKAKGAITCGVSTPPQSVSLSGVPDSAIGQNPDGTYFICQTASVDSRIEQLEVAVQDASGAQVCRIQGSTGLGNAQIDVTTGNSEIQCNGGNGINTAIGCIPFNDQNALIGFLLRWGIGIGGGIAFLLIIAAGFQIMTSRGDPNRLKTGQELMTSAIAGLLMLIFSVVILRIIGFDILQIGAFK